MSQPLGEKLRLAREERGISLTEVAEQTRISPHYLHAIENDDYRTLPGGIFNKGFIKSYAKYVGIDENEALADYNRMMNSGSESAPEEPKAYRPEVLTDDRTSGSMIPTVLTAVLVLGLITAGILFGLNYLSQPAAPTANTATPTPANAATPNANAAAPADAPPTMANLKVEFKTTSEAVSLAATVDGKLTSENVAAGTTKTFEPKESLKLSYYKAFAKLVELTVNGKKIALPEAPIAGKRNAIEFEINKDNLAQIWADGSIVSAAAAPAEANSNTNTAARPAASNAAAANTNTAASRPAAANAASTPAKPANAAPEPTRKVITVGNSNRQ